tara:strand:+ start:4416 stop:5534 length:1119 start_codon:yes stop_codon:yes gene_type:complete
MKINYLAMSDIPSKNANALHIVQMCNAFIDNGLKVKLFLPSFFHTIDKSVKQYYGTKHKINIIRVGKNRKFLNKVDNIFVPLQIVLKNLKTKPDLILTRNLVMSFFLILLNKKHILELHDDIKISGKFLSFLFKKLKLLNSKNIIRLIFITKGLKEFISKNYFYNKKNYRILSDSSSISFKFKKLNIEKKRLNIGYFGSIYKSRGINLILKLSKIDQNNDYYIYGGTNSEIMKLKLRTNNKNIFLFKQIPYSKIPKHLEKMDVLLMPYTDKVSSTGDVGNIVNFMSPMKMFDYLKASRIVISSDIPVLRFLLKNNVNAKIVKNYKNVFAWKNLIYKNSKDNVKNIIISNNAKKTVENFTWENRAKVMLDGIL